MLRVQLIISGFRSPLKPFFRIPDIVPVIVGGRKSIIYFISLPADYPAVFIRSKTSAFGKGQIDRSFFGASPAGTEFFPAFSASNIMGFRLPHL